MGGTVMIRISDRHMKDAVYRKYWRYFEQTRDACLERLIRADISIAAILLPREHIQKNIGNGFSAKLLGECIRIIARPGSGESCWEYELQVQTKPNGIPERLRIVDALNCVPKKAPKMALEKVETPAKVQVQSAVQADQNSAMAAMHSMMKAAVRLDEMNGELAEKRRILHELKNDSEALRKRIQEVQDNVAEIELAIEGDQDARLAKAFLETMQKAMGAR